MKGIGARKEAASAALEDDRGLLRVGYVVSEVRLVRDRDCVGRSDGCEVFRDDE